MVFPKRSINDEIDIATHDVRHHWDLYAGEAMRICHKLTEKLYDKPVVFKVLGEPDARGIVVQVTDLLGTVMVLVKTITKSGAEGTFREIYMSDIKSIGKVTLSTGGSGS